MLRARGTALDGSRQIGIVSFQKRTSDFYLSESVDFLVRNFSFGPSRLLLVLSM